MVSPSLSALHQSHPGFTSATQSTGVARCVPASYLQGEIHAVFTLFWEKGDAIDSERACVCPAFGFYKLGYVIAPYKG